MFSPANIKTLPVLSSILTISIAVKVLVKAWHKIMQVTPCFPVGKIFFPHINNVEKGELSIAPQ